jgi:4-methyl-5(b-hydroxyethyl)-thiazole monophosphate biosynthesis
VLGQKGLLRGKRATCFPGFEDKLTGATVVDASVVTDGNVVTARGAGVSWQFAAAVTALLAGEETARRIMEQIQWEF